MMRLVSGRIKRKDKMKIIWNSLLSVVCLLGSMTSQANDDPLTLENCHVKGIKQQISCGKLTVPENYQNKDGDKISINFVVLPAIDNSKGKDPLMFLAGGPGQAAVSLAGGLYKAFNEIRKTRDLILVDQRGTGESHPLQCHNVEKFDAYQGLPADFNVDEVKECIANLSGDLSQYNSENAIRDFDAVRAALGHDKIAIYGGSYGTRAGLVYMRLFPDSLSSVILDSVGPIEVPIGLFGKSSARSFDMLLENCKKETSCNNAYPNLRKEFNDVVSQLEQGNINTTIPHPRLGTPTEFNISKAKFISTIFTQLYSVGGRSIVPLIIHQAAQGNFAPVAGLIAVTDGSQSMFVGLTFNIVCNEDIPRVTEDMFAKDADNDFNGDISHSSWKTACPVWPTYRPNADFYQPVTANIPTLILSGELDPVTPPSNGEFSAKTIPNSKHIVMKNSAHTPGVSACPIGIINEFLNEKDPNDLDESCLDDIPNESFMTGLNGGL